MDGRPNRRNKAVFSYFSGVVLGFFSFLLSMIQTVTVISSSMVSTYLSVPQAVFFVGLAVRALLLHMLTLHRQHTLIKQRIMLRY